MTSPTRPMAVLNRLTACFIVVATVGCGSERVSDPVLIYPASPPPAPSLAPNEIVLRTYTWGGSGGGLRTPLTVPVAGRLTARAAWTSTSDVDLYLALGACDASPSGKTPPPCNILGAGTVLRGPEVLTAEVEAGAHTLIVHTATSSYDTTESGRVVVTIVPR
jgi:hypothetical protein